MTSLDRSSPLPLWAQLTARLGARLQQHEFGERFPTESELVAEYGVSRHTVREALRRLSDAGLVERERGRGSFVRSGADIEQSLGSLYSLAASIEREGYVEESDVLVLEAARDAAAARQLGLAVATELVHVRRLRRANGEPLAVDDSWIPPDIGRPLLEMDLSRGSLYPHLRRLGGVETVGGQERIRAAVPDAETRQALDIPAGEAIFVVERIARAGERAIEWRQTAIRGDRFSFVTTWAGEGIDDERVGHAARTSTTGGHQKSP